MPCSPALASEVSCVCVDIERQPVEVVTAYVTSKIEKYWSLSHEGKNIAGLKQRRLSGGGGAAEVLVGEGGADAAAGGALEEAELEQEWLVHVLDGL